MYTSLDYCLAAVDVANELTLTHSLLMKAEEREARLNRAYEDGADCWEELEAVTAECWKYRRKIDKLEALSEAVRAARLVMEDIESEES